MNHGERSSQHFLKEQSLRSTRFEREAAFAHRWAVGSGRPEEILFSEETLNEAIGSLAEEDMDSVGRDNKAGLAALAVSKYLSSQRLEGAKVEVKPFDRQGSYADYVVVVVSPA